MKLINTDSIKDFQTCALLYDYRHQQKMPEAIGGRDILIERFENTIKDIIYYFFYKQQGGYTPSYSSLLNRWEKLWFSDDITSYDILTEKHESAFGNSASLTTKAAAVLLSFHENFFNRDYIPIAINDDYIVPVTKLIKLKDKFDIILSKDDKYFVIKIVFNYKSSHQNMHQIDFASMYNAFCIKHGSRVANASFGYIDLTLPKIRFTEYEVTKEDLNALIYWAEEISSTKVFAPRRGLTWYCKRCPFDKPCSKWSGWIREKPE